MSGQLKEVRERIKSVISTQQITKAMKMVSAAKLRRAQQAIVAMRPYSDKLTDILHHVMVSLGSDKEIIFNRDTNREAPLIVVITSSRGLCGAYNTNIIKSAIANIEKKYSSQATSGKLKILAVGKKANEYFQRHYSHCEIISDYHDIPDHISLERVQELSHMLIEAFSTGEVDSIDVSFGRFKNAGMQFPETVPFLPIPKIKAKGNPLKKRRADYLFEPDKNKLLNNLIPAILDSQIYRYVLDNQASEHGARMTAMDKATENANEILKELRINYNKARQAAITTELTEIVSGAAALEG